MKLIIQKATNFKETNKVIEILSTDINNNVDTYFIKSNEILIIKYSDTEEQFLIKDLQSNIVYDNNSETLVNISDTDLLPLGGSKGDSRPYKVYTALLTQSGTNAPVATVLENTLDGVPVWSYESVGNYSATLIGAFDLAKTFITLGICDTAFTDTIGYFVTDLTTRPDSVNIATVSSDTNVVSNGILYQTSIEIRVYN